MLTKRVYNMQTEKKQIPFSNGVFITRKGEVYIDEKLRPKIRQSNGNFVRLNLWRGEYNYSVAELMIITWFIQQDHAIVKNIIIPIHIDGDKYNDNFDNLEYRFSNKVSVDGIHFRIPMYSRYTTTVEGDVFDSNFLPVPQYTDPSGYVNLNLYSDKTNRVRTLGRHRILCMVFKEYNEPLSKIIVNHLDGIPGNDELTNLEWTDWRGNINHAFRTGLRSDNKPTLAYNVFTKEEKEFQSLAFCSVELGFGHDSVRQWVNKDTSILRPGGWLFKLKSDPTPWRVVSDPIAELKANGYYNYVKAYNIHTGEEFIFENDVEASAATGVKRATIGYHRLYIKKESPVGGGWMFRNGNDDRPWPKFTSFELEVFKVNSQRGTPVRIVNTKTGVESYYTSVVAAAKILEVGSYSIHASIKKNYKFGKGKVYIAYAVKSTWFERT